MFFKVKQSRTKWIISYSMCSFPRHQPFGSSSALAQMETFLTASGISHQNSPVFMPLYRSNSSNQSTGRAPTCIPVGNEGQVHPGWSLGFLLGRQNPSGVSDPACHLQPSCDWGHPWHKAGHKGVGNFYLWNSGCSLQTRWVHLK